MHLISEQHLDDGVIERELSLDEIPCTLWTPRSTPAPLILMAHNNGLPKKDGLSVAPRLFSEDRAQNLASLSRLAPLRFETVADGHAGVTRDAKRKLERLLAGH